MRRIKLEKQIQSSQRKPDTPITFANVYMYGIVCSQSIEVLRLS